MRVLLIEDDSATAQSIELMLKSESFNVRSEEHTSELQSQSNLVCRLLLEKKKNPVNNALLCPGQPDLTLSLTASQLSDRSTLATFTLDASTEPCVMCVAAIHCPHVSRRC